MSHEALQRVIVRMLYDPGLAAAVARDADAALAGLPLSAMERRWLRAVDPRAFGTDTLRRDRTLHALIEEFPAFVGRALAIGAADAGALSGFFGSDAFHGEVQRRGSLARGFGRYLAGVLAGDLAGEGVAGLEAALAAARRGRPAPWGSAESGAVRLVGTARAVESPVGTLDAYQALVAAVGAGEQGAVATLLGAERPPLPDVGVADDAREWTLIEVDPGGEAAMAFISEPLFRLVEAARPTIARGALEAVAVEEGATPGEAAELVDELIGDGLLERR